MATDDSAPSSRRLYQRRASALSLFTPVTTNKTVIERIQRLTSADAKKGLVASVTRKMRRSYVVIMICALLGVVCQIVEAEIVFGNGDMNTPLAGALKAVVSASTAVLLWLVYVHYCDTLILGRLEGFYHENDTILSTKLMRSLVMELCACAMHCPPSGSAHQFSVTSLEVVSQYTTDAVFSVLICTRIYLLVRFVHARGGSHDSVVALSLRGFGSVNFTPWHTFKMLLVHRGLSVVMVFFWLMVVMHAHAMRVIERPLQDVFGDWWSCMWCAAVTMTTVGYGDMYPQTHAGRFIGVSASIVGTIVLALLVTAITKVTELSPAEHNVMFMVSTYAAQTEGCHHHTYIWRAFCRFPTASMGRTTSTPRLSL